jgi:hypothetical protein
MLINKETLKMDFDAWVQVNSHLKAPQVHATIVPHKRTPEVNTKLMVLMVLKTLTDRIDTKLAVYKPSLQISISPTERMAILVAHQLGLFQYNLYLQEIIISIDKKAA